MGETGCLKYKLWGCTSLTVNSLRISHMFSACLQPLLSYPHIHKLSKECVLLKGPSVTCFEVGARYEQTSWTTVRKVVTTPPWVLISGNASVSLLDMFFSMAAFRSLVLILWISQHFRKIKRFFKWEKVALDIIQRKWNVIMNPGIVMSTVKMYKVWMQ